MLQTKGQARDGRISPLRSSPHEDFAREMKAGVDAYFARSELSRHAGRRHGRQGSGPPSACTSSYALIVSGLPHPAVGVGPVPGDGRRHGGHIGFSVTHDALHGAYAAGPRVNRLLGHALFAALGANSYI